MNIKNLLYPIWNLVPSVLMLGCATSVSNSYDHGNGMTEKMPPSSPMASISNQGTEMELQHSLESYLEYAALQNAGLRSKFSQWKAALERIPQFHSLPDPKFHYGYYISEVETRVGPQNHRVGIAQTFPWFGKLGLRNDKASAEAEIAKERFDAEKVRLFYQVKAAYYEYYYLGQAIDITHQNIELLKNLEGVAQAKVRAGTGISGVMQAQIEIGKLEDRLQALNEMRLPIAGKLNVALGLKTDSHLPMPKAITYSPVSIDWDLLASFTNQSNHKVKRLKHQVKTRSIDVALAKKQFYPDLQLGMDYIATGESVNPGVSDSGKDPVMVTFSVNIPLWYGEKRAALAEAEHQYHASIAELQNTRNQLNADLKMALFEFQDAERKFILYQTTLTTLARNSLNVARESYEGGRVEFSELIDAQRLLLEFQLSYERARTDHEISIAKIERILGRKLPQLLQMKESSKL